MKLESILSNKFAEIFGKHCNPIWAREELEWLVYSKYRHLYDYLEEWEQNEIDDYFDGLVKLHGGR